MTARPSPSPLMPVAEARARILARFAPLPGETVSLDNAVGRVLATDVAARLTQPPAAMSAMDGWAVRGADLARLPVTLARIGSAPAGHPYPGRVGDGQAVRIFTGALLPDGADSVVLQEDCAEDGQGRVTVRDGRPGGWIRPAGHDFHQGDVGIRAGRLLSARDVALAAAMNHPFLTVHRRPRVAILPTGDEVVMPGEPLAPGQIISSNGLALAALIRKAGGDPVNLGIAADSVADLTDLARGAVGADLLVTTGGASVGEHDLIRDALAPQGLTLDFWKIAMRPGKPLMFGDLRGMPLLGLPGNPVAVLVCALLFLLPVLRRLQGLPDSGDATVRARTAVDLPANDRRQDYVRATLTPAPEPGLAPGLVSGAATDGLPLVTPFGQQDSGQLRHLANADCLLVRPAGAPPLPAGSVVDVLSLDGL